MCLVVGVEVLETNLLDHPVLSINIDTKLPYFGFPIGSLEDATKNEDYVCI